MSEDGAKTLAERLKEKQEEQSSAALRAAEEALVSFRQRLESLLRSELGTTEDAIKKESESLKRSSAKLYRWSVRNPLLIGLTIFLSIALGTWGLSFYLSSRIEDQLKHMSLNETLLKEQVEGLKKGTFFKLKDGRMIVRIEHDSEKQLEDGTYWATLLTR